MLLHLKRVWIQITANKRQFSVLLIAVAVGLLMWSRLIIIRKPSKTAVAAPSNSEKDSGAEQKSENVKRDNHESNQIQVTMSSTPYRDPFSINAEYFPKPTSPDALRQDHQKWPSQRAEDPVAAQALVRERLEAIVNGLSLDAVMEGGPVVIIDGVAYKLNDEVPVGKAPQKYVFELIAIRRREVDLARGGFTFTLSMK